MPHTDTYCTVAECEAPTRQGRIRCDFHEKRYQRGQSLAAPKAERLSSKEKLLEAAYRYAESDAEDDAEYAKNARDLLRAARQFAPTVQGELVRQGQAQARRRGVRFGRPPALTAEEARALLAQHGAVAVAARVRGVSRAAIRRALERGTKLGLSFHSRAAA